MIVPTLGPAERLGPCLAALTEGLMDGILAELILVDGGPDPERVSEGTGATNAGAGIEAVADAAGATLIRAPRGRGLQLAAGARASRGTWLLFLHGDTVLAPGWAAAVARHIAANPEHAGYFRLAFDSRHPMARVTAGWANLRARALGLPFGDQGLIVARTLYDRVGGYPEIPLMEDLALARRLRGRLVPLYAVATTSAERYMRDGWLRRGVRNLSTQALFVAGASPGRLAERYRR